MGQREPILTVLRQQLVNYNNGVVGQTGRPDFGSESGLCFGLTLPVGSESDCNALLPPMGKVLVGSLTLYLPF